MQLHLRQKRFQRTGREPELPRLPASKAATGYASSSTVTRTLSERLRALRWEPVRGAPRGVDGDLGSVHVSVLRRRERRVLRLQERTERGVAFDPRRGTFCCRPAVGLRAGA